MTNIPDNHILVEDIKSAIEKDLKEKGFFDNLTLERARKKRIKELEGVGK